MLKKADWELTLKELRNQRVQLQIQLEIVEAGITRCEAMKATYPECADDDESVD